MLDLSLPAPIRFRKRTLANGLAVLTAEDHKSPTVAIQVWYRVGSKDDPPGRSGFAHLFEHLMFKRTKNMPDEMLDRLTEDVGGENNAYTSSDVTVYHEVVPSHHLERLLWAEADRMANLEVDAGNFASERDVVKEEYRQSVLAPPYGLFDDAVEQLSWAVHPYKRSTIGNIAELNAASLDDVRAFHRTFYRPDNATLVVVGDFDPAQLDPWIDQYFGVLTTPSTPIPRVTVKEPARTAAKQHLVPSPSIPLPAVAITYLTPNLRHPDAAPLQVLDMILSGGESARLYRSLIYKQELASEANSGADLRPDAGLFQLRAVTASGKSLAALEKALLAEIALLQKTPPTNAELSRAKTQLLTAALHTRETAEGVSGALGEAAVLQGDPESINTELRRLLQVTPADVLRVARQYLVAKNAVTVRCTKGKATIPDSPATKPALVGVLKATSYPEPPAPAKPRPIVLPTPSEKTLTNHLRTVVVPRSGSGLVTFELVVRSGAATDPVGKAGRAALTAALLTKGTKTRTAEQLAAETEALGGSISASAGWDATRLSITVAKSFGAAALNLLADVTRNAVFAKAEVERERTQEIDDITVALEEPGTLAALVANRRTLGESYGHARGGLPATLKSLTQAELLNYYHAAFRPENATLIIAGDITQTAALALAESHFGAWRAVSGVKALPPMRLAIPKAAAEIIVIDKPDAGQAAVVLIRPGITRTSPNFIIGQVTNSIVGGGYSSRLNKEVRIKRGLSYGASSSLDGRVGVGPFTMACQTKNESAGEVARVFLDTLKEIATTPPSDTELATRVSALVGPEARRFESTAGLSGAVASCIVAGLPLSTMGALLREAPEVTAAQVQAFAAQTLSTADARIVIAGDAKKFLPDLKQRFGERITVLTPSTALQ